MQLRTDCSILIRYSDSSGLPERGGKVFPNEAYADLAGDQIFELIRVLEGGDWLIRLINRRYARITPNPRDIEGIAE
jgi:hypothetical protein